MQNVYKYTSEHKKWVLENSKKYENAEEMRKDFNETFNLQTSKSGFITLRYRLGVKNPDKYTKEQDKFIEEMFKQGKTYKELVEIFNKKFNTKKTINGLQQRVSDRKLYTNNGNDKRRRYLNQCPVGTIREHNDGRAIRMLIKIKLIPEDELGLKNYYNKDYWIPYAKYIYENYYNCKLDESETVYHIDGDFRNNSIDNLVVNKVGAYGSAYGKIFGCYKASEEEKAKNEKKIKAAFLINCVEHQISKLEQE